MAWKNLILLDKIRMIEPNTWLKKMGGKPSDQVHVKKNFAAQETPVKCETSTTSKWK